MSLDVGYTNEFNDPILDELVFEYRSKFPYKRSLTLIPDYQRPTGENIERRTRAKLISLFLNAIQRDKELTRDQIQKIFTPRLPKNAFT